MTDKPANRTDLITHVAEQIDLEAAGLSQQDLGELFDMFMKGIVELANQRPYVQIRELGRFEIRKRKARLHPAPIQGGEPIQIAARKVLWFTASPGLARPA